MGAGASSLPRASQRKRVTFQRVKIGCNDFNRPLIAALPLATISDSSITVAVESKFPGFRRKEKAKFSATVCICLKLGYEFSIWLGVIDNICIGFKGWFIGFT